MKKGVVLGLGLILSIGLSFVSYAGEWKQDTNGQWWQNDDGTYPKSSWQWIDGNQDGIAECYYFDENGYMMSDTTTPDKYQVNADGAWVVDGVIQTQTKASESVSATNFDKFYDVTKFFHTDLQYYAKAKEILGNTNHYYYSDDYNSYAKEYEITDVGSEHPGYRYIEYDSDGKIKWIRAKPNALISGLEDKKYSVDEITQIAKDAGATDIKVKYYAKEEPNIKLGGVYHNGKDTWTRRGSGVTFIMNDVQYWYLVVDCMIGSYEFNVTKKGANVFSWLFGKN